MIIKGDCIEEMKKLDENSVEARIKPFLEQTKLIANNSHQTKPPKTIGENRLGARDKTGDTYIKCTNDS
jgi:DNA modification methylase|tara:strand:- start:6 stop:212 length:207 start_codon:yes stop_codon:yes gene_type:complete